MALDDRTADAVGYLLEPADDGVAERVRSRLGLEPRETAPGRVLDDRFRSELRRAPAQVRLWLLRTDDPELNEALFAMGLLPPGLARDVVAGLPFGPGAPDRKVERSPYLRSVSPTDERLGEGLFLPRILNRLYAVEGGNALKRARKAAREVRSAYWPGIAKAHAERPLPGHARWALAERIDCPPELRASFGSHPKFSHRLRQAGIVGSAEDLVTGFVPAISALPLLAVLHRAKPRVVEAGTAALRRLVAERLGGHVEAWAILAQSLPGFVGTPAELVELAAAKAGPEPAVGSQAWVAAARPTVVEVRQVGPKRAPAPAPRPAAQPAPRPAPAPAPGSGGASAVGVPKAAAPDGGSWFGRVLRGLLRSGR